MPTTTSFEFTDANFATEVLQSDQPVLVDFWAPWCGPCRVVSPVVEELAEKYAGTVKVGKLNVDDHQQTAAQFGIASIPSVLLFQNGKPIETLVGVQAKQRYEQVLDPLVD